MLKDHNSINDSPSPLPPPVCVQVRELAGAADSPLLGAGILRKKESMGVCFIGKVTARLPACRAVPCYAMLCYVLC
jgi:hypothetical protein